MPRQAGQSQAGRDTQPDRNERLHPTALLVLAAVQTTEERATNHLEWIAEEAGVSDSTASRWLNRMHYQMNPPLVAPYEQDWIWGDKYRYWRVTTFGEFHLDAAEAAAHA